MSFPDRSPIGELHGHMARPLGTRPDLEVEEFNKLFPRSLIQLKKLERYSLTIREVIHAIFSKVQNIRAIDSMLLRLDLPCEIRDKHADNIALRFDCFPRPWLDVIKTEGEEYLAKRIERVPPTAPAMWEIIHEIHSTVVVGVEPSCRIVKFVIDWSRSTQDIIADFTSWVNGRHPGSFAGHKIAEGWLTKLAAYRLKQEAGHSYGEAIKSVKKEEMAIPWQTGILYRVQKLKLIGHGKSMRSRVS